MRWGSPSPGTFRLCFGRSIGAVKAELENARGRASPMLQLMLSLMGPGLVLGLARPWEEGRR